MNQVCLAPRVHGASGFTRGWSLKVIPETSVIFFIPSLSLTTSSQELVDNRGETVLVLTFFVSQTDGSSQYKRPIVQHASRDLLDRSHPSFYLPFSFSFSQPGALVTHADCGDLTTHVQYRKKKKARLARPVLPSEFISQLKKRSGTTPPTGGKER